MDSGTFFQFLFDLKGLYFFLMYNESFTEYSILGWQFLSFRTWATSVHSLFACWVSDAMSALSLIGNLLKETYFFSHAYLRIFSLCFAVVESLAMMCHGVDLFCSWLSGILWTSRIWPSLLLPCLVSFPLLLHDMDLLVHSPFLQL